jgi:hypothetical protein
VPHCDLLDVALPPCCYADRVSAVGVVTGVEEGLDSERAIKETRPNSLQARVHMRFWWIKTTSWLPGVSPRCWLVPPAARYAAPQPTIRFLVERRQKYFS